MRSPMLAVLLLLNSGVAAAQWSPICSAPGNYFGAVYDIARGRVVAFGTTTTTPPQTSEWDGVRWHGRTMAVSPPTLGYSRMAYDAGRRRTVLIAPGSQGTSIDTWEWDGSQWARVATTGPTTRSGCAMVYDLARQRAVLFGGVKAAGTTHFDDTWEWDGMQWSLRTPSVRPPARQYAAMAYDVFRQRTVLVGGNTASTVYADAWEWDGTNWQQIATGPPPQSGAAAGYDLLRREIVLYGSSSVQYLNETWTFDGTRWTQRMNSSSPGQRAYASLLTTPNGPLLVGGDNFDKSLWLWDGAQWTPQSHPVPNPLAQTVIDPLSGDPIVFDWPRTPFQLIPPRMLTWRTDRWVVLPRSPGAWPYGGGRMLVLDTARGRVVLFGAGYPDFNDTWEWDGRRWHGIASPTRPVGRFDHAMAYDSVRGRVVLFGGRTLRTAVPLGDTWTWDGVQWRIVAGPGPSARYEAAMAFAADRGRIVLFGGLAPTGLSEETWEFDGTQWLALNPTSRPTWRWGAALAFDPRRNRTVLYGGSSGSWPTRHEHWEWDGSNWSPVLLSSTPGARFHASMVFWPRRGRIVMRAGDGTIQDWSTLWVYGPTPAGFTPYGAGCGSVPPPALSALGQPHIGSTSFALDVTDAPAQQPVILVLGAAPQQLAIGNGCEVLVQTPFAQLATVTNAAGFATLPLPLPNLNSLRGLLVFMQGVAVGPTGLALTNGGQARLGD
jgi:hypothetical protein